MNGWQGDATLRGEKDVDRARCKGPESSWNQVRFCFSEATIGRVTTV